MTEPKYQVGQLVKVIGDHNKKAGKVLEFKFHSGTTTDDHSGWTYSITSKYYDPEINDMVAGHKVCKEEELEPVEPAQGQVAQA